MIRHDGCTPHKVNVSWNMMTLEEKEDIGGYMVRKLLLKMVELGPTKTATLYARKLLRQIFRADKLTGKSISG
ncbi:hypothetical protein IscW_ISCW004772 [Ixodes scapularis]|uniref:Uncharacterized protein n=1 Tax=Ixodes scapularis TaxID=6945 RepID=B7PEP1_IXOSC|nr:hypothetical protein IscW_ISCW004772 [Ixodes scapularis]|eukprot:XP_002433663.1 hypothetical protein IscW_ISCW004772 [Ixodes scapularis]